MENMKVNEVVEVKEGKSYKVSNIVTDEAEVYNRLSHDLIAKKISACTYIKSIKRVQLYNGFIKIIVTYDNGVRGTFTISDR